MLLGPTMDPKMASAISLRLPHLGLRMREHSHRAMLYAQRLQALGISVIYPGLEKHAGRKLLERIGNLNYGFGGILGIDLGSAEKAGVFMEILQNQEHFGFMAVSLGFSESLMTCPASTTSSELGSEDLLKSGIQPGLVRISVGYTGSIEQRWRQLESALRKIRA
jgi:methionine-gamma-lyase